MLLLIGFGAAALYVAWTSHGRTIAWKGNELRVRTAFGGETVRRISDVISVSKGELRGEYRLRFRDGSSLRLSAYLHGAPELVAKLPKRASSD